MSKITISQAAKILGVSKKTLMRWDKPGLFPARRESVSNVRIYDKEGVEKLAEWFDLRKKHLNHLKKLKPINDECRRFISTRPLDPYNPPKGHNLRDMKKAFNKMKQWQCDLNELRKKYIEFMEDYYKKLKK